MKRIFVVLSMLIAVFTSTVQAEAGKFGLGVSAGTLGLGVDAVYGLTNKLNVRINYRSYDFSTEVEPDDGDGGDDLEYEGDLVLDNVGVSIDFHPFSGGFRVSAGLQKSDNRITALATCANAVGCEFGDGGIGNGDSATVDVDMSGTHPYFTIGWGNFASGYRLGLFADIGVMLQGEPDVSVTASCTGVFPNQTLCDAQAQKEEDDIQKDVSEFDVYPVLNVGLRWRFN